MGGKAEKIIEVKSGAGLGEVVEGRREEETKGGKTKSNLKSFKRSNN